MKRLVTARQVDAITKRGRHAVGHGLYLQISEWNTRSWIFRYTRDGVQRHVGLGSVEYITLAQARQKAFELRQAMILNGTDPLEAKQAARTERAKAAIKTQTFKECAEAYIAAHEAGWRNSKSSAQWRQSLADHVFPRIGALPPADVDVAVVLSVLEPIWTRLPETASRVRGRIEMVLDWAKVRGLRDGENPARWRGHLESLLPARSKVRRVEHYAAISYGELPSFMADLRKQEGTAARALEFVVFTAARPGEAVGATWDEIDLKARTWTLPPERMKGGHEHRVALSDRAIEILEGLPRAGKYVFIGARSGQPLNSRTMSKLLQRMGRSDVTVHGMRSAFSDWAHETTSHPNHAIEISLAHSVGNKVEKAYRRGDLFDKRRRLMNDWACYCSQPTARKGEVTTLRGQQ